MSWSWRREALLLLPVVAMFIASAIVWPFADESIAVHFNASGEADRYGGKFEALLVLPLISLGIALLLAVVPRIDPAKANYASFTSTYNLVRVGMLLFMGVVHALLIATALGSDVNVGRAIYLAVGGLFLLLGNLMTKFRPNYFAGIRTPWTLSSARSWTATHRQGGRLFIAMGLGFMAMALVLQTWFLIAVLVLMFAGIGGLTYYSWRVWREDPDRVPATMTTPAPR
jgi:uncharacterized membrane protein